MSFRKQWVLYYSEPLGLILRDKLKLSPAFIWVLGILVYFGGLLLCHQWVGTPAPADMQALLSLPTTSFYYPNLGSVLYDLVGNPLFLFMLVHYREYIPRQIQTLEKQGYIEYISEGKKRWYQSLLTRRWVQIAVGVLLPFAVAVTGIFVDAYVYDLLEPYDIYVVFLSFLGRYARVAVGIQIIYIFIILQRYQYRFRFQLFHPDQCGGLSSFGNLALAGYLYIFLFAIMQSLLGATAFESALTRMGAGTILYLWIFFPLLLILLLNGLILKPKNEMQRLRDQYLSNASKVYTHYHQRLSAKVEEKMDNLDAFEAKKHSDHLPESQITVLETYEKLNQKVLDLNIKSF
jgi:hypothetical protein